MGKERKVEDDGSQPTAPSGWMTRRYIFALSMIAVLALSAYTAFEMLVTQHEKTLAVVNVSGRQRMLSQRSALYAERLVRETCPMTTDQCLRTLEEATALLASSHLGLTRGSEAMGLPEEMSETVRALYYDGAPSLDDRMRRFIQALRVIAQDPAGDAAQEAYTLVVTESSGPLLQSLDAMVLQYQVEGETAFDRLHMLETGVMLLTLMTLLLEAALIFQPMVRQIRRQFDQLGLVTSALRRSRDHLEDMVSQRTRDIDLARQDAERANLSKSRFLAAAGHDLMQPLEAAVMYTGVLGRQIETPKGQKAVAELKNAHQAMNRLIRSVLEISKLEAGVVQPQTERFALNDLLDQLVREYRPRATEKDLELRLVPTSAVVETDPALLERVLRNLLSNAVRYTRTGRVLVGVRHGASAGLPAPVDVSGAENDAARYWGVAVTVADTGPGIPASETTRIFEEFTQLDTDDRDRSEGLGLGLAIVDRLSRLLGLHVSVQSIPDHGTAFTVHLPRKAPPARPPATGTLPELSSPA